MTYMSIKKFPTVGGGTPPSHTLAPPLLAPLAQINITKSTKSMHEIAQ